jgi:hypothetical protein
MKNTQAAARENNCRNTSPTAIASQAGEWTTAVRCATLNSVVVVLFTLRGPLETKTPIVAAVGVFHSSPRGLGTEELAASKIAV